MAKIKVIQRGESLPFIFDRSGESISGFVCTITVKQFPKDIPSISRVIPPDIIRNEWTGFLTETETSALDTGLWILNALLVSVTTDQEETIPLRFHVSVKAAIVPITFTILDSDGNSFTVGLVVLDSDGNPFTVSHVVLDSDENSFIPI